MSSYEPNIVSKKARKKQYMSLAAKGKFGPGAGFGHYRSQFNNGRGNGPDISPEIMCSSCEQMRPKEDFHIKEQWAIHKYEKAKREGDTDTYSPRFECNLCRIPPNEFRCTSCRVVRLRADFPKAQVKPSGGGYCWDCWAVTYLPANSDEAIRARAAQQARKDAEHMRHGRDPYVMRKDWNYCVPKGEENDVPSEHPKASTAALSDSESCCHNSLDVDVWRPGVDVTKGKMDVSPSNPGASKMTLGDCIGSEFDQAIRHHRPTWPRRSSSLETVRTDSDVSAGKAARDAAAAAEESDDFEADCCSTESSHYSVPSPQPEETNPAKWEGESQSSEW